MLNLPNPPSIQKPKKKFMRSKTYTKLDKLAVYYLLFDSQLPQCKIDNIQQDIDNMKAQKNCVFNLLFSNNN